MLKKMGSPNHVLLLKHSARDEKVAGKMIKCWVENAKECQRYIIAKRPTIKMQKASKIYHCKKTAQAIRPTGRTLTRNCLLEFCILGILCTLAVVHCRKCALIVRIKSPLSNFAGCTHYTPGLKDKSCKLFYFWTCRH